MSAIRNVHERVVEAPAETVGALLDRVSAEDDPVFPVPAWPPMRFDRPLGVGAKGGHGRVRYAVTAYEPGHRIRFAFGPPGHGSHELTVEPLGERRCRVRHVLEHDLRGTALLGWLLVVRPAHDTVIEELLDNVERAVAGAPAHPVRWSPQVRLVHRLLWPRPKTVATPEGALLIRGALDRPGYEDAYAMELRPGMPTDPQRWTGILRDAFPVLARTDGELLLDVNTAGLKARASILVDERYVTLSTAVRADSTRARLYWGVVRQVHPFMARTMLRRTHRALALAAPSAAERAGRVEGRRR
ncbi:SRPBCC family protein [Streptomyces sp. SAS_270]|uniref:SRPBCC family protein n=1 Tax=Streptomyces sp. SAS_270 TaxID=3412748 RepID=UPI00403D5303